jgi:hypothetical protein
MNDEDFGISFQTGPSTFAYVPYSNTLSGGVTGDTAYGAIDAGYDFLRAATYKTGVFAGYTAFHQVMNAFGCTQVSNQNSDCVGAFAFPSGALASPKTTCGKRCGSA